MEKKGTIRAICLLLFMAVLLSAGVVYCKGIVQIPDEEVPLGNTMGKLIEQTSADIVVIPDKYNTGVSGTLTAVTSDSYISGVKFGTTGVTDRKLDLYHQSVEVPEKLIVENYDFSAGSFQFQNADKIENKIKVIFKNCKFSSYVISGSGQVEHEFYNCTFTHFAGSNAVFYNCYFGGGTDGDGINPGANCTFNDCMIADLIEKADIPGSKQVDGFQIFGSTDGADNTDIMLNNCRFEVPAVPYTIPSGAMNCPVSIIMRYSDAENISFKNCYVNGGKYYAVMVNANERKVTNLSFENVHIGESSKTPYTCDGAFDSIIRSGTTVTDKLYVSSVRKLNDGIHISVTNDTNTDRILSVVTPDGISNFDIKACPKVIDLQADSLDYDDFPFDMDIVVPSTGWLVCYDITETPTQIRFVNWSGKSVYLNLDQLYPATEKNDIVEDQEERVSDTIAEDRVSNSGIQDTTETVAEKMYMGSCGKNIEYVFEDKTLTLSGTGITYDYHSGKKVPWYELKDEIEEVIVSPGIVGLGNLLFGECSNLKQVILPDGLTYIGKNVFKKCKSIEYISIPDTLTDIGERCFTSRVLKVNYRGTIEKWKAIKIAKHNQGLIDSDIQYVDEGDVIYSGKCGDNANWSLTSKGTLKITGMGQMYHYHSGMTPPWYKYVSDIQHIVIENGITEIGNFCFRDCANVNNIELPQSVQKIGINSFSRCKGLQEIAFTSSLTSIGKNAFAATKISAVIYYGVEEQWNKIANNPFENCNVVYGEE